MNMRTIRPKLLFLILVIYLVSNSFSELFSATLELLPADDGSYHKDYSCYSTFGCSSSQYLMPNEITLQHNWWRDSRGFMQYDTIGLIEFNLSSATGLFTSGNFQAFLMLKLKECCSANFIYLRDMNDSNEDGIIAGTDVNYNPIISQDSSSIQPGDFISINVTTAIEHDLFASGQTAFSGFVLEAHAADSYYDMTFYDSYDGENNAPRLRIVSGEFTTTTTTQPTTTTTIQQSTTTTTAPATVINLSSFTATPKFSKVIIQWSTEAEIDNAGFNIYRSETEDGNYIKINDSLIPAQGSSTQGASYEFTDTNVQNRKTYYYKLEDIDLSGKSTMHGPVKATPRWLYGAGK